MNAIIRAAVMTVLCAGLAACNAPRGAGFQSEVLAARDTPVVEVDGAPVYDFSVFSVTRNSLPVLQAWPSNNTERLPWIANQAQPQSSIITAGDTLSITIWDAEENSLLTAPGQRVAQLQNVTVGTDGRIFLPFVGTMRVSGMAPDTARTRIQEMLVDTVPSAQVQLRVEPGRANTANLVAGVRAPGVYPLPDRNVSLLTLIATGGGVNDTLPNPQVRLFRGNRSYGIGLNRLFDDPALDTVVQGGDRVLIEPEERYFLSLGATTAESLHVFPKDQVTALDALAIVGGVNDLRANPQAILILREYPASATVQGPVSAAGPPQERVVFTIDLTTADGLFSAGKFQVQNGDLVYATESPLGAAATVIGLASATLRLTN
ncbi:polysaccharide biosynthesis/export family protein [Loktanella sp. SALINAS62]|uniref:polysaccharide biosynthesis/export family protein n=1 Tax=Loktanella sp. SALINAS62 TaxID=2706124 RepID=UPI001B8D3667|nr:polysaccharide biosynthesis/export family protein [Loktanella sp. SALINAS62]MBS1301751.1 polysaccharide export protein [Loktanella sp. SALINAS62]